MTDSISISFPDGSAMTLDQFAALTTANSTSITAIQSALAMVNGSLANVQKTMVANQQADQAALAALQTAFAQWSASKSGANGTTAGGGTSTGTSSGSSSGTSSSTSGGTSSGAGTPVANPEGLTLSIAPGTYTFSNISPGNNTICIVRPQNNKNQYPAWSIVRSNIKLAIDYAGYVHALEAPGAGPITVTVQCVDGTSTTTASFSIPVVQVGAQKPTRANRQFGALPASGTIGNKFFSKNANGTIVNFYIGNPTQNDEGANYVRFVQPFVKGDLPKGASLKFLSPPVVAPLQVDIINTHSDGSCKTALITVNHGAELAMNVSTYALALDASPAVTSAIDLAAALSAAKYALSVDIDFLDLTGAQTSSVMIDVVAAMQAALSAGTASYFQRGALVTQARVVIPVSGSLYINADISAFANGLIVSDFAIRNDAAMAASGGPIYTSGTITQNGNVAYSWTELYQTQYQAWSVACSTAPQSVCNVELDPGYLIKANVIQPYNLGIGVDASVVAGYEAAAQQPGWLTPLANNNVDVGMFGTGGRADIGYETQSAVVTLITQDPRAIDYCCAQAEASGSAPWNYFDIAHKCWVNTQNYPNIWLDQANRGGISVPGDASASGATQPVTTTPQSWALDQAHQPDLAFVPWLYTGRRFYLDQLLAQGCWAVTGAYGRSQTAPGATGVTKQCLWVGQVRGMAWNFRQVSNGALCAPDGSSEAACFADVMAQNATYGAALQASLQATQGNCWGYLAVDHGVNNFAPWEQNYLQPICALAGARGHAGWSGIAAWFARFTVQSFLPQADGPYKGATWNQVNGASYELYVGAASNNGQGGGTSVVGTPAQSWAELEYWTVIGGQSDGGETIDASTGDVVSGTPNWSHSQGDYSSLCSSVLAWAQILGVANAAEAATWLQNANAPYDQTTSFQLDPTFSLAA
jgi:hypothetical protein